jgi:hypothetical protein
MMTVSLRVDCYAGYRGEETPRRFHLDGQCIEIVSVIDRWLTPDHRYFKVEGNDGQRYILRHDVETQHWEVSNSTTEK